MSKCVYIFGLLMFGFFYPEKVQAQAQAKGYQGTSNVQFLLGNDLTTITLEHVGGIGRYEQFGFADIFYLAGSEGIDIYTELYPRFLLKKFNGDNNPFLANIYLGAGFNGLLTNDFVALLGGPVWQFNVPPFNVFQLESYYYRQLNDELGDYEGTFQLTYSWSLPFHFSPRIKLLTRGFFDYIGDRGPGTFQIVTQPQLLLDVGNIWDSPGRFYTGTEWNFWENMGGTEDAQRSILQWELIWFF